MKGGKDEEKLMGPLFPRLHISDADKGGPKAPPRNKMALYEQFSIPPQRLTSGSASILPAMPNNGGNLIPSTPPPSHGAGQNRSLHTPFRNSPASSHLAERFHSYSSGGMKFRSAPMDLDLRQMKPTDYPTWNASEELSMSANFSLFQPLNIPTSKDYSVKKFGEEDDIRVPILLQSGKTLNWRNGKQNTDKEKLTPSIPNRQLLQKRNQTEEKSKMFPKCFDHAKRPASSPLARGWISDYVKGPPVSLNKENRSTLVDELGRAFQEKNALKGVASAEAKKFVGNRNDSALGSVSRSRPSPNDIHRSPNRLQNFSECHKDQRGSSKVREGEQKADTSDTSIVDSTSGVDISPDDVVGVMGQKQFWQARRVIVQQQKVLAVQVFELHRLIKVQKLFAASPDLLIKVLPGKKLVSENVTEAPSVIAKLKDDPEKPKPNKGLDTQQPNPCSPKPWPPPPSTATDAKPPPWCFHPPPSPGNQWLVPVMLPSEGLVYKPFTGPYPPAGGFMAPVYGPCGPLNLTPLGSDFPASHHQGFAFPPFGIRPFGMSLMNPSVSSSAFEQVSHFARARSDVQENHLKGDDTNSGSSSFCFRNSQASKESEVGTTKATSPERVQATDALPLFPTAPTVEVSDKIAQTRNIERSRVIKVVPHNRGSASESAARIFQSIQEERKHYD